MLDDKLLGSLLGFLVEGCELSVDDYDRLRLCSPPKRSRGFDYQLTRGGPSWHFRMEQFIHRVTPDVLVSELSVFIEPHLEIVAFCFFLVAAHPDQLPQRYYSLDIMTFSQSTPLAFDGSIFDT
jgi:hypothetical protein